MTPLFLSTPPGPVVPTDRSPRGCGWRCLALAQPHTAVWAACQLRVFSGVCSGGSGPWKFRVWLACSWATPFWPVFQEAVFNKSTGQVVLKTFSLYRKLLTLFRAGHDQGEACSVRDVGCGGRLVVPDWMEGGERDHRDQA